jgi:competence protein ComEC
MAIFAISFALGTWLLQQQPVLPDFVWAWLLPVLPVVLFIPQKSLTQRLLRNLLILLLAAGAGFYHAAWRAEQRLAISLPADCQGRDIQIEGVVAELPHQHARGQRFVFDVEHTLTPQVSVPDHIYLSTYANDKFPPPQLQAGERWQLTVRLKQPHGTANPHGFDFEVWMLERNLRAVGYIHNKGDNQLLTATVNGFGYQIQRGRAAVRERLTRTLGDAPYAGVIIALAVGDQQSIPASQWQVFTRTGVNHLMSISGLHITMLASLGFALVYGLWRRSPRLTLWLPARKAAVTFALLVAAGYALLAGFGVPAQRTLYMVGAVAAALWFNRNYSLGQLLSFALLAVLIPDPWAVLSPGFWLSFGAVFLILLVTAHRLGKIHWLIQYGKVQWAMTIGLTPLLLALFQQVSLVSPLANVFAIPLVSLIVVPLTLLGAVFPLEFPLWLAHFTLSLTMAGLEWLNALPQAVWTQHAPPPWSIPLAIFGAIWVLLPRGFPARWIGLILILPLFFSPRPRLEPGTLALTVFDVGQGLSVVAQTRNHALLYDTGPDFSGEADSGNRILVPALRGMGISHLDNLILSHDDIDHTGGTASLLESLPVEQIITSVAPDRAWLADARKITPCADGQRWNWEGVTFEMLHPAADQRAGDSDPHDNDKSCVLRISTGRQQILLVGDMESGTEQRLLERHPDKLKTTLLVVPHHGSKTSSGESFVAASHPEYAIFTVGYRNRFGHPRPEIWQRYIATGAKLLRTDESGAILVRMNGQNIEVETERQKHARYWQPHTNRD